MQFLSPEGALKSYVIWTMGSLGSVTTVQLSIMAPVVVVGLALSVALIKPLNTMLLGENYARTMGLDVALTRRMVFVATTLLSGAITAFCGPIGFIGIAAPHVSRMIFRRADHRTLMPASMVVGASSMLLCDIVSQLPGSETALPVNTITALLGIPIVVMVIIRNRNIF
jgi:iron complex transport system permease protein